MHARTGIFTYLKDPLYWGLLLGALVFWLLLSPFVQSSAVDKASLSFWMIIKVVVLSPFAEEILFRSGLQGLLSERVYWMRWNMMQISIANIVTSLLFALSHWLVSNQWWALWVFVPSLLFGLCYSRYHNVWSAIMLHGYYNAGYLFFIGSHAVITLPS